MKKLLVLSIAAASICLSTPMASARPPANPCSQITPASLDRYANEIGKVIVSASADASKYGTDGAYAVAATNSRDLLKRAQAHASAGADMLRASDPSNTTYAEAGQIKEKVRAILEVVPQATHWAVISAIYHKSRDAEQTFEGGIKILDQGNGLFANASRCYLTPYLQK